MPVLLFVDLVTRRVDDDVTLAIHDMIILRALFLRKLHPSYGNLRELNVGDQKNQNMTILH